MYVEDIGLQNGTFDPAFRKLVYEKKKAVHNNI